MKKLNKNSNGFTVIEVLLVIVTLAIIGVAGYFVAKHIERQQTPVATTATATKTTTSTPATTNPYIGWKTDTLKYEGITFQYPSSWTLQDNSRTMAEANSELAPVNCTLDSGSDNVLLTASNGAYVGLETGVECASGKDEGTYVGFTPISVLGNNNYVAFENSPTNSSLEIGAAITTSSTVGYDYPASKNITGSSSPYNQFVFYPVATVTSSSGESLSAFESDPNYLTAKLIFESLKYN